jgi:hypothetical protein
MFTKAVFFAITTLLVSAGGLWAADRPKAFLVAAQGDPAPGTTGLTYAAGPCGNTEFGFDEPQTNESGNVVFLSCLSDGTQGLFFTPRNQPTTLVVVSGSTLSGLGTLSAPIEGPRMNEDSTIIFADDGIFGGNTTAALFLKKKSGPLKVIAKQGDPAPGTNGGVFSEFDDMSINDDGDVAFIATYIVAAVTKTGVFFYDTDGSIRSIIHSDNSLPKGDKICSVGDRGTFDGPWVNDGDVVAFVVDCSCAAGTTCTDFNSTQSPRVGSVYAKPPGQSVQPLVLVGDPVPTTKGGTIGQSIGMGSVALNDNNVFGFEAEISGGSTDAVVATKTLGGSIKVCAVDGQPADDTTGNFASAAGDTMGLSNASMNADGVLVFHSSTSDPINFQGVFTCKNGNVDAQVLTGDTRPNGGTYGNTEEEAVGDNAIVFDDEVSSQPGVYLIPNIQ